METIQAIDFSGSWDAGFAQLVGIFDIELDGRANQSPISQLTREYLDELSQEKLTFPLAESIKIIDTLKSLPRSGKIVRLENYRPEIRVRSIYDHILSLAHTADCLWNEIDHGLMNYQQPTLALCIAFHELNEVLIGDLPQLTDLSARKQRAANLHAYDRLERFKGNDILETFTNNFIKLYLNDRNFAYMDKFQSIKRSEKDVLFRFFYLIDKIDLIIAVWRYLHVYRGRLDPVAAVFLTKLMDFFGNTKAQDICHVFPDAKVGKMAEILYDRELAREFYVNSDALRLAAVQRELKGGMKTRLV